MCGLFGFLDIQNQLTTKQKTKIVRALANECESRGNDAAGIAYTINQRLHIYKRPLPAHCIHWSIPSAAQVIMGHTRATTQGNAKHWQNNHPFYGKTKTGTFALAHNGVLWNDRKLRTQNQLPTTDVETDSYIAVQLLEQQKALDLNALQIMAEQIEGSFTFTLLDEKNNLYFVKGDSPLCIWKFKGGLHLYASTEELLKKAVCQLGLQKLHHEVIPLNEGEILKLAQNGRMEKTSFDTAKLCTGFGWRTICHRPHSYGGITYDDLYFIARCKGISGSVIDELISYGMEPDEIEELLYQPGQFDELLSDFQYEKLEPSWRY